MTWKEYKYWFFKTYGHDDIGQTGCGGPALTFMTMLLALFLLCSCRTQYVPVETIRTEYRDHYIHDSIIIEKVLHDSTVQKQQGDTVIIEHWHTIYQDRWRDRIQTDTLIKTDSVQVPYPVPAQLSRWQSFCCDYGKVMLGTTLVLFVLLIILTIKHLKKKSNVFV